MLPPTGYKICVIRYIRSTPTPHCTVPNRTDIPWCKCFLREKESCKGMGLELQRMNRTFNTSWALQEECFNSSHAAAPLLWKAGPELSLPAVLKHNAAKQQSLELIFIDSAPVHHCISVFRLHVKYEFDRTCISLWLIGSTKLKSRKPQRDIQISLIFLRSWERKHWRKGNLI